jgi:hypothetical protein
MFRANANVVESVFELVPFLRDTTSPTKPLRVRCAVLFEEEDDT